MGLRQHPGPLTIPAVLVVITLILTAGCALGPAPGMSLLGSRDFGLGDPPGDLTLPHGPAPPLAVYASLPASPPTPDPAPSPLAFAMQRAGSHYQRGIQAMRNGDADQAEWEFDAALETLLDMNLAAREPLNLLSTSRLSVYPTPTWLSSLATPQRTATPDPTTQPEADELTLDAPALLGPEDLQAVSRTPLEGAAPLPEPDIQKYDIPIVFNDQVKSFIDYFQTRKWGVITRAFERASRYLPTMRKIFHEKGLPEDLLNLAFIESAVNPRATSRARAAGIWQFIQSTGRLYGMRTSWWLDERRDPEKSTRGAAEYLRNLYRMFESWPLALAAYNAGEGAVQRAIERQRTRNFWSLRLPKETQLFVPAFMAMTVISKEPERYGFSPPPEEPYATDEVVLRHPFDLKLIAHAARTTVERIRELNPQLIRWATPPDIPQYTLRIPAGRQDEFLEAINRIPPEERVTWIRHRVRKGETAAGIAKRYGTDLQALVDMNRLRKRQALKPGATLLVPPPSTDRLAAMGEPRPGKPAAGRRATAQTVSVKKGDSLWTIARAHGVSAEDLRRWNNLPQRGSLRPGQTLKIARSPELEAPTAVRSRAAEAARASHSATSPKRYVVKHGDTLWEIARAHGISAEDLRRWNNLPQRGSLRPGQELHVSSSRS